MPACLPHGNRSLFNLTIFEGHGVKFPCVGRKGGGSIVASDRQCLIPAIEDSDGPHVSLNLILRNIVKMWAEHMVEVGGKGLVNMQAEISDGLDRHQVGVDEGS